MTDSAAPEGTVVRPAVVADLSAIGRLAAMLVAMHHELDRARFFPAGRGTAEGYADYLRGQIGREDTVMLVAERDGLVIGYLWGAVEGIDYMALRGPGAVLHDIVVDPSHRGGGVGRRLLEAGMAALAGRGVRQFTLSTAALNVGAQRLFARAGFRPTMIEMTRDVDAG